MNPLFTKPTNVFSESFTATSMEKRLGESEKIVYEKTKAKIQKEVIRAYRCMKWVFEADELSSSVRERLKDRVTKRGLVFEYKSSESCFDVDGSSSSTKSQIKISLPEKLGKEEGDGYFSDGWERTFKASEIQKSIQRDLNNEYQKLSKTVEAAIAHYPGVHEYKFDPDSISPIVLEWLKQELQERGFVVNRESDSSPCDISGSHTSYYASYKIINPKIKNYESMKIYL